MAIGSYVIIGLSIVVIRESWLHFRVGFILLLIAALAGLLAAILSLKQLTNGQSAAQRRKYSSWLVLVLGPVPFSVLLVKIIGASHYPMIHDISTDTLQPPPLIAALSLRDSNDHSTNYAPETATLQHEAYPGIHSIVINQTPSELAVKVRAYMTAQGWKVVSEPDNTQQVEAVATSSLFKFEDDIAVRFTPEGQGTRVDVRSASRVGKSDLGANARRIEALLIDLQ